MGCQVYIFVMVNWHLSKQGIDLLTSITWWYCGLWFRSHWGQPFFFFSWLQTRCWFLIGSQTQPRLTHSGHLKPKCGLIFHFANNNKIHNPDALLLGLLKSMYISWRILLFGLTLVVLTINFTSRAMDLPRDNLKKSCLMSGVKDRNPDYHWINFLILHPDILIIIVLPPQDVHIIFANLSVQALKCSTYWGDCRSN